MNISNKPKRNLPGMKQCLNCSVCPYVRVGKSVTSTNNNYKMDINTSVNCSSSNVMCMWGARNAHNSTLEKQKDQLERGLEITVELNSAQLQISSF